MISLEHVKVELKKLADRMNLPNRTVNRALRLLERLSKEHRGYFQGLKPLAVSASCLYLSGLLEGEGPTQWELCQATGWRVSESTIRRHYRSIAEKLQLQPLLAISESRRIPRRVKYLCPLCGESSKNLDLWRSHLEEDHHLRDWGQSLVRTRDFDREGNLVNPQIVKRIREAERRWAQVEETLGRIEGATGN